MKFLKIFGITILSIFVLWLFASFYLAGQSSALIFQNKISWAPIPQYNYKLDFLKNSAGQNFSTWTFENKTTDEYILYLHGNSGRIADLLPNLNAKANVISPAYPGYSESEGEPTVDNVYEAALITYNSMVAKGVSESKITILGHSMGGSPATYLASQKPKAKKLVLINTFSSIQSMCFRQYSVLCGFTGNIFNTANYAPKITIPIRHFAYKGDLSVPFAENELLFTYFKDSTDKKFIPMDKYTHTYPDFELINKDI
jgi:pimeloyl-ACP methyl ester carboxylesterase